MKQSRLQCSQSVRPAPGDGDGRRGSAHLPAFGSPSPSDSHLLLREVAHRCANDLQLVVSLLQLQARHAATAETRDALEDAANRVAILAHARTFMREREREQTLEMALQRVCAALNSQAEPRAIEVSLAVSAPTSGLSPAQITNVALCVNELATNAIKHAFGDGKGGSVAISVTRGENSRLVIRVEDDGAPLTARSDRACGGMGFDLVRGLLASVGGTLHVPSDGSKRFDIILAQGAQ